MLPGVYFYRNAQGSIIYIGKAKVLKNRVSQYFHSNRPPKTELMIRNAASLEYVVTADEFEALVLECTLIKQYKPRYNILLKDDKGYPFIRVDTKSLYPRFSVVNKKAADGAEYFGPYGGRGVAFGVIEAVSSALTFPFAQDPFPKTSEKADPVFTTKQAGATVPAGQGNLRKNTANLFQKLCIFLKTNTPSSPVSSKPKWNRRPGS